MADMFLQVCQRWLMAWLLSGCAWVHLGADLPNILWITSEDNGPHLGCYGDTYAHTPNLDALAAKGVIYRNAWSTAPVCAPARTTLISGVYPPATGGQHMRSMVKMPAFMKMYPQYLRELAEILRIHFHERRHLHHAAHVLTAGRRRIDPGDQRGSRRRTHRSSRPRIAVDHPLGRQGIQVGRVRIGVAIAPQMRAIVFTGDPQNIGKVGTQVHPGASREQPGHQPSLANLEEHVGHLTTDQRP